MPSESSQPRVLLISSGPGLADARRRVLEVAGYAVTSVLDMRELQRICVSNKDEISLVIIGHFLAPREKRRVWHEIRKHSDAPILELYASGSEPALPEAAGFLHESRPLGEFIQIVHETLQRNVGAPPPEAAGPTSA